MRAHAIAGSLLALSGLLLPLELPRGACEIPPPRRTTSSMIRTAAADTTVTKPAGKVRPVAELAAILDKTDDKDTFLLTVIALRCMGPEAKEALPAIIRNAERLGLVKGLARAISRKARGEADTKVSVVTEEMCEAILEIASAAKHGKQRQPTSPPACCTPAYNATSPVVPTYNATPQVVPAQPVLPAPSANPPSLAPAPAAPGSSSSAPTIPLVR